MDKSRDPHQHNSLLFQPKQFTVFSQLTPFSSTFPLSCRPWCPLRTLNLCALFNTYNMLSCMKWAKVNRHPLAHHEGWMVRGQETVFCWVSVPYLTMVSSIAQLVVSGRLLIGTGRGGGGFDYSKQVGNKNSPYLLTYLVIPLPIYLIMTPTSYKMGYQGETRYQLKLKFIHN